MKMIIAVALALVAIAVAAPYDEPAVEVVENVYDATKEGYHAVVRLSNGIAQESTGRVLEAKNEEGDVVNILVVEGRYTQLDENGQPQVVEYIANEKGFQARGPQIPVAEPVKE